MVLQLLTILLAIIIALLVLRAARQVADNNDGYGKLPGRIAIFIAIWLLYLTALSYFEVLNTFAWPPRIPMMVIFPLFIILGITLARAGSKVVVSSLSLSYLIYIQSFRIIVELIIWGAYKEGFVPIIATFEGYNYDVVVGLTAVPVAHYAKKAVASRGVLIAWNVAGLVILANTVRIFIASVYFPEMVGKTEPIIGAEFVQMPYLLIAGLFMPFAVYVHALSIKQLLERE